MDPLSITASTIAIVELGLKLVKGLEILRDLSHVPDQIAALIEELQELQGVLAAVCVATRQRSEIEDVRECSPELKSLLAKAGNVLSAIASHCGISVNNHLDSDSDSESSSDKRNTASDLDLLSRFRWIKDKKKIQSYRERLKTLRSHIVIHLVSLNL